MIASEPPLRDVGPFDAGLRFERDTGQMSAPPRDETAKLIVPVLPGECNQFFYRFHRHRRVHGSRCGEYATMVTGAKSLTTSNGSL
jgi:hypothetical protein